MSSELKIQFLNYMTLQRFSDHTKRSYVTGVKLLAKYYLQSPDTLTNDQIQGMGTGTLFLTQGKFSAIHW